MTATYRVPCSINRPRHHSVRAWKRQHGPFRRDSIALQPGTISDGRPESGGRRGDDPHKEAEGCRVVGGLAWNACMPRIRWEMGHGGSPAGESIHVVNVLGLQDARIGLMEHIHVLILPFLYLIFT